MANHAGEFDDFVAALDLGRNTAEYLLNMPTWGGHPELRAMAMLYGRIDVWSPQPDGLFPVPGAHGFPTTRDNQAHLPMSLLYTGASHYDALVVAVPAAAGGVGVAAAGVGGGVAGITQQMRTQDALVWDLLFRTGKVEKDPVSTASLEAASAFNATAKEAAWQQAAAGAAAQGTAPAEQQAELLVLHWQ
jgi:hypothetical protein